MHAEKVLYTIFIFSTKVLECSAFHLCGKSLEQAEEGTKNIKDQVV